MSTIIKADASGAVTLPADLCRAAGVAPGAELVAEVQGGQIILGPRNGSRPAPARCRRKC
jgi:antitoxin component of MazEF toxin-antitoxin module